MESPLKETTKIPLMIQLGFFFIFKDASFYDGQRYCELAAENNNMLQYILNAFNTKVMF